MSTALRAIPKHGKLAVAYYNIQICLSKLIDGDSLFLVFLASLNQQDSFAKGNKHYNFYSSSLSSNSTVICNNRPNDGPPPFSPITYR